jgi:adenylate cyclase
MKEKQFATVIALIKQARTHAIQAVNRELINLYWRIGEHISKKVEQAEWGQSVVKQLAEYLQINEPDLKGFSDKNLWRMKQFYEAYKKNEFVSTLLTQISWCSPDMSNYYRVQIPNGLGSRNR